MWSGAKSFCKSFNMDLVTLETLTEARAFLTLADREPFFQRYGEANFQIDGMTTTLKSTTQWYWTDSGNKFSFPIPWYPGQPDNQGNVEFCLTLIPDTSNKFLFHDINCQNPYLFVCQRFDFVIP